MQTLDNVTDKHLFQISGWDQEDTVRMRAEKMGLLVHTDFPTIEYPGNTIEIGLCNFYSTSVSNSYASAILPEIDAAQANTTSRLASMLIFFKESIPEKWRSYNLIPPGTTWISPDGYRGLTRLYFKQNEGWNFGFQQIKSFPVFENCRFLIDCRNITFPKREGNLFEQRPLK